MGWIIFILACWLFPPLGAAVTAIAAFVWFMAQVLAVTAVATVAVAAVAVTYSAIKTWYEARTIPSDTVEAIRNGIGDAVIVRIDILSKNGLRKDSRVDKWTDLSDDMKTKFAGRDRIVLKG